MRTIVRFRTAEADYAIPVEEVREVRSATGLAPLPAPLPGVAGLMHRGDNGALPVLAILGALGRHVVVIEKDPHSFGLLVEEVTGVLQVDDAQIGAPPPGQLRPLVSGVLNDEGGLVLLLDVDALARLLDVDALAGKLTP
jgi:chemotaxis signal transduction protein